MDLILRDAGFSLPGSVFRAGNSEHGAAGVFLQEGRFLGREDETIFNLKQT